MGVLDNIYFNPTDDPDKRLIFDAQGPRWVTNAEVIACCDTGCQPPARVKTIPQWANPGYDDDPHGVDGTYAFVGYNKDTKTYTWTGAGGTITLTWVEEYTVRDEYDEYDITVPGHFLPELVGGGLTFEFDVSYYDGYITSDDYGSYPNTVEVPSWYVDCRTDIPCGYAPRVHHGFMKMQNFSEPYGTTFIAFGYDAKLLAEHTIPTTVTINQDDTSEPCTFPADMSGDYTYNAGESQVDPWSSRWVFDLPQLTEGGDPILDGNGDPVVFKLSITHYIDGYCAQSGYELLDWYPNYWGLCDIDIAFMYYEEDYDTWQYANLGNYSWGEARPDPDIPGEMWGYLGFYVDSQYHCNINGSFGPD